MIVKCWNCHNDFEVVSSAVNSSPSPGINGHDVHCKARYPQLTNVETCLWCTVIRAVRDEEQVYALSAYNNGYTDGYSDAEKKFMNPCLMCGYDDFSTYVCDECKKSLNEDNEQMYTNEDNDGWYTNGTTYMTKNHIVKEWNELFDNNSWLEGMEADENCGIIDCCQTREPEDWLVFDKVMALLWMSNLQDEKVLRKDLIQKFGGTE